MNKRKERRMNDRNMLLPDVMIIDGLNVVLARPEPMRYQSEPEAKKRKSADARILAGLLLWAARQNAMRPAEDATEVTVIFDANFWLVFKNSVEEYGEENLKLLDRMIADSGKLWNFTCSKSGVRADNPILGKADNRMLNGELPWIVSCDNFSRSKYKDEEECKYVEDYPWLENASQRTRVLHKFDVSGDELELYGPGAIIKIPSGLAEYEAELASIEDARKAFAEEAAKESSVVKATEVTPLPVSVYQGGFVPEAEEKSDGWGDLLGLCVVGGCLLLGGFAGYQLGKEV